MILFAQIDTSGFYKATQLYEQGNFKEAKNILQKIEKLSPEFAPCYYFLGLVYHDENQYEKAEKYYLLAGEKDETYAEPYSDLYALRFAQQKYEESIEFAKISIERNPNHAKAYINLASSLNQIEKYEESRENFYKAAQIDPVEIVNLGNAMLSQYNDPKSAIYYYSIVYDIYPNEPVVIMNIGNCYRMIGENQIAIEIFKNGYENLDTSNEMYGIIYSNYFRTLLDDKQYNKIVNSVFDKVSENDPSSYYFYALANYGLGEKELFKVNAEKYFLYLCFSMVICR